MSFDAHLHPGFKAEPLWWEDHAPQAVAPGELPRSVPVAIVGSGYAGLCAALELAKGGIDSAVLEAKDAGFGASTRNAGFVSSIGNLARRYGRDGSADLETERRRHVEALGSAHLVEQLIREENISCHWSPTGHLTAAWTRRHYEAMAAKVAQLNAMADWGAELVPPERMKEELATDFYHGGMTIARSALIHPALYHRGLFEACRKRGVSVFSDTPVIGLAQKGSGWRVKTARGDLEAADVVIATNGYTGELTPQFRRRIVPIGSYIIATEELSEGVVQRLIPKGRSVYDSRRVLSYCRPSPDGRRLLFGGRVRFSPSDPAEVALPLYRLMIERFPELDGCRITHAWMGSLGFTFDERSHTGRMAGLHYALGCNGTGIAMMSYLGTLTARRILGRRGHERSVFEEAEFPTHPLYRGDPWFVPFVGKYYQLRDWLDRQSA
jgi:glycine/D-amino acid oxidase-like deaminating enzyme